VCSTAHRVPEGHPSPENLPCTHDLAVAKLNYLEVPVLLRYDVAAKERIGGLVFTGPGVAFQPVGRRRFIT
jgi:hypothetical protein